MKKTVSVILALVLASSILVGCTGSKNTIVVDEQEVSVTYENGRYRGVFEDSGVQQVGIQFDLEDEVLRDLSFRQLFYKGNDYLKIEEGHELYPIVIQHQQILEYLEGKTIDAIYDLYSPENIVEDIDSFTGATIRGSKILSAIKDGLNRGLYTPAGEFSREIGEYENGRYRGTFGDSGVQQVSIQFDLEDNLLKNISFRHLFYKGNDYLKIEEGHELYPVVIQHQQIIDHLEGKALETIFDLYTPGEFIDDIDSFTGASVRASKVFSAIKDGLNRGLYTPVGEFNREIGVYEDGRYRGAFGDSGVQQVSVQFYLEDNKLKDISFRQLFYKGNDYLKIEEGHELYPVVQQHKQLVEYLEGKSLEAIFDLYAPGDFIDDIDTFTGASIRASKVLSAIRDGLNRGIH